MNELHRKICPKNTNYLLSPHLPSLVTQPGRLVQPTQLVCIWKLLAPNLTKPSLLRNWSASDNMLTLVKGNNAVGGVLRGQGSFVFGREFSGQTMTAIHLFWQDCNKSLHERGKGFHQFHCWKEHAWLQITERGTDHHFKNTCGVTSVAISFKIHTGWHPSALTCAPSVVFPALQFLHTQNTIAFGTHKKIRNTFYKTSHHHTTRLSLFEP